MPRTPHLLALGLIAASLSLGACGNRDAAQPETPAPAGEAMSDATSAAGAANSAAAAAASAAQAAQDAARSAEASGNHVTSSDNAATAAENAAKAAAEAAQAARDASRAPTSPESGGRRPLGLFSWTNWLPALIQPAQSAIQSIANYRFGVAG